MSFQSLDPDRIRQTAERLQARIADRFPDRGIAQVGAEVVALARKVAVEVRGLEPPIWPLRLLVGVVVLAGAAIFIWVGSILPLNEVGRSMAGSVEAVEAAINTALLATLGLVALVRLEARVKRRRVARGLHALRSVIHVIDMHQLTKDPVGLDPCFQPTEHSPKRDLDRVALSRYLDYCAELLAITGKLAALYAQAVPDEAVAQAVNDIELLGASLSRKIWQKIALIEAQPRGKPRKLPD